MAKYPVSGAVAMWPGEASSGADNASTGAVLLLHGTATGTLAARKRVLWLRSFWIQASASGVTWALADASVSATGASIAPALKFRLTSASTLIGVAGTATERNYPADTPNWKIVNFPPPGIKFATNCLVLILDGSGATAGAAGGLGYEEG